MQTEIILRYYWDIFLSHTCEFYPLNQKFISEFQYELNWRSLSKNKVISWDLEFLEKHEDFFIWHELALNDSIIWDAIKIERFKKRLDWYELGRNKNLPITDDFIIKYSKDLFVIEDNPLLTQNLINKYALKTLPKNTFDTQTIKEYDESDFDEVFNKTTFHHNQKIIYDKVIAPIISKTSIEEIFSNKFNNKQSYYFFGPAKNDIHGLTPEFEIDGHDPFMDLRDNRHPQELPQTLTLKNGSLQEGPDRLYETPRFRCSSICPTILVSENVKQILEQHKLPHHFYHKVNLVTKKLKTNTSYYILEIEQDTLDKHLIYKENVFHYSFKESKIRGAGQVTERINNIQDKQLVKQNLEIQFMNTIGRIWRGINIKPEQYKLNTELDLYSSSVFGLIINEFLKKALENNFPNQFQFRSAQLLNISIDDAAYESKSKSLLNIKIAPRLTYNESDEEKFYKAKVEKLENSKIYLDKSLIQEGLFSKIEIELSVQFPELFKENYVDKSLKIEGYSLLPISQFHLQNEYVDRYPETYKSVVIAENGVGDSINLLLERDSDYKLQYRLFEFFHDTGEYGEYNMGAI